MKGAERGGEERLDLEMASHTVRASRCSAPHLKKPKHDDFSPLASYDVHRLLLSVGSLGAVNRKPNGSLLNR